MTESTDVNIKYQMLATISSGMGRKMLDEISDVALYSSTKDATEASDVVLSIEIVSLPVGGITTRIACGRMMRRMMSSRRIPNADAASVCPCSTDRIPARTISAI